MSFIERLLSKLFSQVISLFVCIYLFWIISSSLLLRLANSYEYRNTVSHLKNQLGYSKSRINHIYILFSRETYSDSLGSINSKEANKENQEEVVNFENDWQAHSKYTHDSLATFTPFKVSISNFALLALGLGAA